MVKKKFEKAIYSLYLKPFKPSHTRTHTYTTHSKKASIYSQKHKSIRRKFFSFFFFCRNTILHVPSSYRYHFTQKILNIKKKKKKYAQVASQKKIITKNKNQAYTRSNFAEKRSKKKNQTKNQLTLFNSVTLTILGS